jgi:hypothetical protein
LHESIGPKELTNYDTIVSNPLAIHYIAKFMHQTGLLVQFQHAEQEESDDEPGGLAAIEQCPKDAGHSPPNTTTEEGENISQLFEYTVPD